MPADVRDKIELDKITDPFIKHFKKLRQASDAKKRGETFVQKEIPHWQTKL
jgi:hypothetical protein